MSNLKGRVTFMDAGRGLAALVVVEHHMMVYYGEQTAAAIGLHSLAMKVLLTVSEMNKEAVDFFFFISGWAIYLSLDLARRSDGGINWTVFAWHRCRRILPLYWLALMLSWLIFVPDGLPPLSAQLSNLFGNIFFLQTPAVSNGWFTPFAGNGPLWSLAYEAWYYAATPLLLLPFFKHPNQKVRVLPLFLAPMAIAFLALPIARLLHIPLAVYATMWPLWVLGFAFGAVQGDRFKERLLLALTLGSLLAIVLFHSVIGSDTLAALGIGLLVVAFAIICVLATRLELPLFSGILPSCFVQPLVLIGSGSYAIYVLHYPILRWMRGHEMSASMALSVVALLVAAAPMFEQRLQLLVKSLPSPGTGAMVALFKARSL